MSTAARFDTLESRTLLSATPVAHPAKAKPQEYKAVTCTFKKNELVIYGTNANDVIRTASSKGNLYVQVQGKRNKFKSVFSAKLNAVKLIAVYAQGGDDKVTLRDVGYYTTHCLVELGQGNDFYQGSDVSDAVNGGDGDDEIQGFEGADFLTGGAGNDKLFGDAGNDTLEGHGGTDALVGGAGDDEIDSRDSNYGDYISGGPGNDTAYADKQVFGGVDYWENDNIFASIEHLST